MATPGTCAAQLRKPASTIIEGGKAEGSGRFPNDAKLFVLDDDQELHRGILI
jgi:hypothetical protein